LQKAAVAAERRSQRVQRFVDDVRLVGAEEHEVAIDSSRSLEHAFDGRVR
jgi:hypothetical protein